MDLLFRVYNMEDVMEEKARLVWCKGTWPEDNYEDFKVFQVRPDETDEDAFKRAEEAYSVENEFYIK